MTMTFDFSELKTKVIDPLGASERRIRAGVATGLTRVAIQVRDAEVREMRDVFDRPTPYTLNSMYVKPANAISGEASTGIKDNVGGSRSAVSWLRWQILGGLRTQTAFERLLTSSGAMRDEQRMVPAKGAKLDAYGNVSRGQLVQILSQLRIESSTGSARSLPRIVPSDTKREARLKANKIRRALGRAGGQYIAFPDGRGRLKPGIYMTEGRDFGAKLGFGRKAGILPVLLFVTKAEYEAGRFDFLYVAQNTIRRVLPAEVSRALTATVLNGSTSSGKWL